jgi:hypothetical protein
MPLSIISNSTSCSSWVKLLANCSICKLLSTARNRRYKATFLRASSMLGSGLFSPGKASIHFCTMVCSISKRSTHLGSLTSPGSARILEICQKCDHFAPFAGASAKYLGEREGGLAKKRGDERKKSYSPCHVSLCGRGNELRALGIVAGYLANALFYLTNDTNVAAQWGCRCAERSVKEPILTSRDITKKRTLYSPLLTLLDSAKRDNTCFETDGRIILVASCKCRLHGIHISSAEGREHPR